MPLDRVGSLTRLQEDQPGEGFQNLAACCAFLRPCRTALHFIRCIKPNSQQVAAHFDPHLVLHQLKCCGVLEVTRIARAGYPTRYKHDQFAARYMGLLPDLGGSGAGGCGGGVV